LFHPEPEGVRPPLKPNPSFGPATAAVVINENNATEAINLNPYIIVSLLLNMQKFYAKNKIVL
ncbi:MAG: hypothetical protein KAJ19_06630, partial [Gammaproteobacteria bacterium]|nr:hypothetical protein [Gammaproteobacteria bacterium]